jgi:hypothetical protein
MEDQRTISLALAAGEVRQLLVLPGTTLLVISGRLRLCRPPRWLAEHMVSAVESIGPEQVSVIEAETWIELSAIETARAVLIPPDSVPFWSQVGDCLQRLFGPGGQRRQGGETQPEV